MFNSMGVQGMAESLKTPYENSQDESELGGEFPEVAIAAEGLAIVQQATPPAETNTPSLPEQIPIQRRRARGAAPTVVPNDSDYQRGRVHVTSEQSPSDDVLKLYLREIGKTPLLNAEQEVELSKRIEAGLYAGRLADKLDGTDKEALLDAEKDALKTAQIYKGAGAKAHLLEDLRAVEADGLKAKDHMIVANLRLVVSVAKRYTGHGMPMLDLIQEGNLGLVRAVEKFDYAKGFKFSTYATWWVRQAVTRALADQARLIRVPVHMVEKINKRDRVIRDLLRDLGHEPTDAEVALEMDITVEQVEELARLSRHPVSLSTPLGDGGGSGPGQKEAEFGDLIEDREATDQAYNSARHSLLGEALGAHLNELSERERKIIEMRHGLIDGRPRTLEQIGKTMGVTRERIRQLETKAMKFLYARAENSGLRDYMPD